eukprot:1539591-Prymnesium_polylepis.1
MWGYHVEWEWLAECGDKRVRLTAIYPCRVGERVGCTGSAWRVPRETLCAPRAPLWPCAFMHFCTGTVRLRCACTVRWSPPAIRARPPRRPRTYNRLWVRRTRTRAQRVRLHATCVRRASVSPRPLCRMTCG